MFVSDFSILVIIFVKKPWVWGFNLLLFTVTVFVLCYSVSLQHDLMWYPTVRRCEQREQRCVCVCVFERE